MTRRVAWALLLLPLLLAGCKRDVTDYAWHQEIRVTVTTQKGAVAGASVQAVEARFFGGGGVPLSPGVEGNYDLRGEAVVVDLGEAGVLFALLSSPELAERAYRDLGRCPQVYEQLQDLAGQPPRPLPVDLFPRLVTFGDIDDPTSAALVDPDDLAASFGEGYALEAVTIAVTDAPVTEGVVERVLGWWLEARARTQDPLVNLRIPNDSPRGWEHITPLDFWSLDQVRQFNESLK